MFQPFQGKYADADPLLVRAIEIGETALGLDDPSVAVSLKNRARLLQSQVRTESAHRMSVRPTCVGGLLQLLKGPQYLDRPVSRYTDKTLETNTRAQR